MFDGYPAWSPDGYPAWSPDGTQLAFESDGDVYIMREDGSVFRLTDNPAEDMLPDWRP